MPIYEYQCSKCGEIVERLQKLGDRQLRTCPECSGRMEKLVSRTSFHLKGGGWYDEGYAKNPPKPKSSSSKKSTEDSGQGSVKKKKKSSD